ncbi:MAG: hypothetical protein E7028_09435 [Planctomycetaceae bacterium]|nr:hypothetical protein [Planctomycetaceae bacterium]
MKNTFIGCVVLLAGIFVGQTVLAQNEGDWKTALDKGVVCAKDGNIRTATFYFLNALGKTPGNMEVIETYRNIVQGVIDSSVDTEAKYAYLIAMEGFLQEQISTVPTDKVETLVLWLDGIEDQKVKLENAETEAVEEIPELTEQEELAQTFSDLKSALEKQQEYVRRSLAMCKEDPNFLDIASYQLQECEQIMRSLIAVQPMLPRERKIETAKAYADLQTLSETVQDTKSAMVWKEYCEKEWMPFIDNLTTPRQWNTEPTADKNEKGIAEQRIILIQKQMSELQQLLPKLSGKYLGDMNEEYPEDVQNAAVCLKKMQNWLKEASEIQRDNYNKWAVKKIQECNDRCFNAQGPVINGKEGAQNIAKSLIENLGPIDQMYLTPMISRCYQEVLNKYLTDNQLYKIKDSASWNDSSTVGYTLLKMDEQEKVQLSQF